MSVSISTTFEVLSFTESIDIIGGHSIKEKWPRHPDHANWEGASLSPKAIIWYVLPAYKIWRFASAVPDIWLRP